MHCRRRSFQSWSMTISNRSQRIDPLPSTNENVNENVNENETTLRARWLIPVAGPPIENGSLRIRGERILRVGRASTSDTHVIDLGDVAVMPALVNAHTHLEFSDLTTPIGQPGTELAVWISQVVRHRGDTDDAATTISKGIDECFQNGTGLVGEIATTPWAGMSGVPARSFNPIEVIAMAETLGLSQERADAKWNLAKEHLAALEDRGGVSPHAPYSTPPELIQKCVELSRQHNALLAMHVAESPAERELLQSGCGPFADSLRSMGMSMEGIFPWDVSKSDSSNSDLSSNCNLIVRLIQWLARCPAALLVHGNDLQTVEIEELQRHRHLSVVFCPRTHHFFRHRPHPVAELLDAGINVALGTDSRASNPDLSLWREARFLMNHRQDLSPEQILFMATQGGAIAMQRQDDYGSLDAGRLARLASVPCDAADMEGVYGQLADSDATPVCLASADAAQS